MSRGPCSEHKVLGNSFFLQRGLKVDLNFANAIVTITE
jgi:hypothetical protein